MRRLTLMEFTVEDFGGLKNAAIILCPGCVSNHVIPLAYHEGFTGPVWTHTGGRILPSISPAFLVSNENYVCHSWIVGGQMLFQRDSTHALRSVVADLLRV